MVDALNGKRLWSVMDEKPGDKEFGDYNQKLQTTPALLRHIVKSWWASGPNLRKLRRSQPALCAAVDRVWKANPIELVWGDSGRAAFITALTNAPCGTPQEEALRFFLVLITNPQWHKLAGPCARCGNYYVKKKATQKVYCSRKCGNNATALANTRQRRKNQHDEKLRRADAAAAMWVKARTKLDWKPWVSRKEPDITAKFLTRAVNEAQLKPPVRR